MLPKQLAVGIIIVSRLVARNASHSISFAEREKLDVSLLQ